MQKLTWPTVALALIAATFLFGIFVVIPDDEPQMRTGLLGMIIVLGQAVVGFVASKGSHEVAARLDQLEDQRKERDEP